MKYLFHRCHQGAEVAAQPKYCSFDKGRPPRIQRSPLGGCSMPVPTVHRGAHLHGAGTQHQLAGAGVEHLEQLQHPLGHLRSDTTKEKLGSTS